MADEEAGIRECPASEQLRGSPGQLIERSPLALPVLGADAMSPYATSVDNARS